MLSSTPWKRWLLLAIAVVLVAIYLFPLYWMSVSYTHLTLPTKRIV